MKTISLYFLCLVGMLSFLGATSGIPVNEVQQRRLILHGGASTQDWLSDLILIVFGQDAAAFLKEIDRVLRFSVANLHAAEAAVIELMQSSNSNLKDQLEELMDTSLQPALDIPGPVIGDLSLVLPAITKKWGLTDVSSIIEAILGKTFELFLKIIGQAYVKLNTQVTGLYNGLLELAQAVPAFAQELNNISGGIIRPMWGDIAEMINYLEQVVEIPSVSQIH